MNNAKQVINQPFNVLYTALPALEVAPVKTVMPILQIPMADFYSTGNTEN